VGAGSKRVGQARWAREEKGRRFFSVQPKKTAGLFFRRIVRWRRPLSRDGSPDLAHLPAPTVGAHAL
jgi:hypothetical protein